MRKFNYLLFTFLSLIGLAASAQFQLNTVPPLNGGNGNAGITFGLKALRTVKLDTIFCTFNSDGNTEVWYTTTDVTGPPDVSVAGGWTSLGTVNVTGSTGAGDITAIPMDIGLILTPGTDYRFYIDGTQGATVAYSGAGANPTPKPDGTYTDLFVELETGDDVGYGGGPPNPGFTVREFNGGVKYTPLGGEHDAAAISVDAPLSFCAGNQDVFVTIANFGINQIDSVEIVWEVNGVAQPTYKFIGLLDTLNGTGTYDTSINIGNVNFNADTNTVYFYTDNPNGNADTTNFNDTLEAIVISAKLPDDVTVFNILTNSVEVNAVDFPGDLDYEYDVAGFTLGTGNTGTSSTAPFSITGLTAGTDYELYVRSNCGGGDTSVLWVGPIKFTTSFTVPFEQDFEGFEDEADGSEGDPFDGGWTGESTNGVEAVPAWIVERANGFDQELGGNAGPLFDHTTFGTGGGQHMVFNSWNSQAGDSAELCSPPIFVSNDQEKVRLSYWYFIFGANSQPVDVIIDTNGVEEVITTYTGQQQNRQSDEWLLAEHYLTGYAGKSIQVKFKSNGNFNLHRPAIDDVAVDSLVDVSTGIVEILEPSGALCVGSRNPEVVVVNSGKDDITSFDVVSDVNGALDTTSVTRTLSTGDTAHITLPAVSFSAAVLYDLRFYTINPNGGSDGDLTDDTLGLETLTTGLVGNVTIDASQPASATNFTTFRSLASRLNSVGVCGNVNVYVAPGDYIGDNFPLESVAGLSDVSQLIIDGDSATNSRDSVLIRNTGSQSPAVFSFNRTSYVTVKNMTVEGRATTSPEFGIHLSNRSNHNTFENLHIDLNRVTFNKVCIAATADITSLFLTDGNTTANFTTVDNCELSGGHQSINFEGPTTPAQGLNVGNRFMNTKMYDWWSQAVILDGSDSTEIINDSIDGGRSGFFQQVIVMTDAMNFKISGNTIITPDEGIFVTNANSVNDPQLNAEISNNMVSVTESRNGNAIYLSNPLRIDMWYNSVYHADENEAAVHFDGFTLADSLDVRNNIFSAQGNAAFRFNGAVDTLAFLRFDNNVFFRQPDGVNPVEVLNMEGVSYTSLAAYQSFRPRYNINSIEQDPQYNTPEDLHIIGVVPSDIADNSVPILVDIDGEVRPSVNALVADIGADEYDPPSCPPPSNIQVAEFFDADTILLIWSSSGVATPVQYEYGEAGFTLGNGTLGTSTNDSANIGQLMENTEYDVYVRQICGRGDSSRRSSFTFKTPCFDKQPGYFADFENSTTFEPEPCWSQFYENAGQDFAEVRNLFNPAAYSGDQALVINSWDFSAIDTAMAITPVLANVADGDKRLRFFCLSESADNALIIGSTANAAGVSIFNPFDTILFDDINTYEQYFVDLTAANGYNETDEHIAFYHTANSGGFADWIIIDDFVYEDIPSCLEPRDVELEFLGSDSVIIGWTDFAGATEWEIEYAAGGLTIGSGTVITSTVNPDTLTGLLPNTDYELVVRAVCTVGDSSAYTPVFEFKTECLPFSADHIENWDALPTFETPDCWLEYRTDGQLNNDNWSYVEVRADGAFSPNNVMRLNTWADANAIGGDTVSAISPRYSDMTDGDKRLRFRANTTDAQLLQDLTVFTVDKRGQGATWTEMENITFNNNNVYEGEYIVDLTNANGYNGTDEYIAFMPGLQFNDGVRIDDYFYEDIPSCPRARDLTAIPGTDTAVVSWNNTTSSDTFIVAYSVAPFDPATATYDTVVSSGGNRDTLRNLFGGTFYEYNVTIICGPGDTAITSNNFNFITECVPYPAPYFKDFQDDRDDNVAVCWEEYFTYAPGFAGAGAKVQTFAGFPNQGFADQGISINSWTGGAADTTTAISPELAGMSLGDKRLRFMSLSEDEDVTLEVYTSDSQDPINGNLTLIQTIEYDAANVWDQVYVDLTTANGYNGTDSVVFLWHDMSAGFTEILVDNLYYEEIPSCLAPREATVGGTTPDSATLSWTDFATGVTEWEIVYDSAEYYTDGVGFDAGRGISVIANSNPFGLTGLNENSDYVYRVRAICTVGDSSFFTTFVEFETPCSPFTAPYFTDFENMDTDVPPECWSAYENFAPNFIKVEVDQFGASTASGDQVLAINMWNGVAGTDSVLAILPTFSDITASDKRLRFMATNDDFDTPSGALWVGTGDNADPSQATITWLDTITPQVQNVFEEFIVNIDADNGYNGTDEYIFMMHDMNPAATFSEIRVDDIHYEEIPTCFRVTDFEHLHFNADSTEISWDDPNMAPEFEVEYGLVGFDRGTGTVIIATDDTDTLYNLISNSTYDVYIRAICTAGDTSFVQKFTFESFCTNLPDPYFTDFEQVFVDSIPVCWYDIEVLSTGPSDFFNVEVEDFAGNALSGTNAVVFNTWNATNANNDTLALITPGMDSITEGNRRITVWASHGDFNLDGNLVVGTTDEQANGVTFNPLDTIDLSAQNVYEEWVIDITTANGYNGTDEHIVIWHDLDPLATFSEIRIDDILYEKIPTCFPPIQVGGQLIGLDSAFLVWNDTNGATEWEYEYGVAGFEFGTGIRGFATDTTVLVNGLTQATAYDVYVRAICSVGDSSKWNLDEPGRFITRCIDLSPKTLPFVENWDNVDSTFNGTGIVFCSDTVIWEFETSQEDRGRATVGSNSIVLLDPNIVDLGPAATLDASIGIGGDTVFNTLTVTLDLKDYHDFTDLVLGFSVMHHDDEPSSGDTAWIRGFQGDPWIPIAVMPNDVTTLRDVYQRVEIDLDSILRDAGQSVGESFQLRLGQSDDFNAVLAPGFGDGLSFDSITITGGLLVGVDEVAAQLNNISVYPNPSNGLFTINIDSPVKENYNVTVRDIKGQLVYEENVTVNGAYRKDVDFTAFAKGIYFMQVQSETNSYVEKLVIQ